MVNVLLIVGDSSNVFSYNFAKWLKQSLDCQIDVFELYPTNSNKQFQSCFDHVFSAKTVPILYKKKYLRDSLKHRFIAKEIKLFLAEKKYDIIHCHWLTAPIVLSADEIRSHCDYLLATFWGGEFTQWKVDLSQKKYLKNLEYFCNKVDYIINSKAFEPKLKSKIHISNGKYKYGNLGALGLDYLIDLLENSSRSESKQYFEIPTEKISVMIGYSGKILHQHIPIINELKRYEALKTRIHLVLPMTRDTSKIYIEKVESALIESGIPYTLLKDRFLTDKEVAILRNSIDFVLQLSTFDGFSRSILEAFCAKSIIIYGDWLGYESYLRQEGLKGICVNDIETGVTALLNNIDRIPEWKQVLVLNSLNGMKNNQWKHCINDWVDVYKCCMK